jgi:SAM-dependent methyltransferase|tara:strand:- start:469 stop:1233 length:765 start_codon:yes stop_codon:yes gene_type:complete
MDRTPSTPDDWEDHWSRLGDAAESNPAQAFRFHLVRRYLADLGQGSRLLDLGCGTGGLLEYLGSGDLNFDATGLELSAAGVARATERLPDARFIQCDLLAPEPPDLELLGWAEQATCSEVLEHLNNPKLFLERARPLLRPGARLVVTVPAGPMSAYDHYIGHRRHYDPMSLRLLLESAGFEVESVFGHGLPFFNLYRLTVIARGERLVRDADLGEKDLGAIARLAMRTFGLLLRLPMVRSRLGWQLVGVCHAPA